MGLLAWWRQRGWQEIDAVAYQAIHAKCGGSVITHPQFIAAVSTLVNIPIRYFGCFDGDSMLAAAPIWNSSIAGSKRILKQTKQYENVDLGNMEIILPVSPHCQNLSLRFKGHYFSSLHAQQIKSLRKQTETLSLLKNYNAGEFSKKFLYNRSREWRLLQDAGAIAQDINEFSVQEVADWYIALFEKRWNKKPKAYQKIADQLQALESFLTGKIIFVNDNPIAIQLIFFADSPKWVSFEFLNAGIEPEYNKYSCGSVLTFLNTQAANNYTQPQGKQLRYSFGRSDEDYKALWCHQIPVYRI